MKYDLFICHASEDKQELVDPLVDGLQKARLHVWYDRFQLKLGDSLRDKIDQGLADSRYGVVVLSKAFFLKDWPRTELDALLTRQNAEGKKVILPIWHGVKAAEVREFSPILASKLAARSSDGIAALVEQIQQVLEEEQGIIHVSVFQTDKQAGLREECLEIIRSGDIVAWRELVDKHTTEIIDKLLAWKKTGENGIQGLAEQPQVFQPWKEAVAEAVKISMPGLIPVLTAIQVDNEEYWRESTSYFRTVALLYRDMGGGSLGVLRIGEPVLYVAAAVGLAFIAKTKQLQYVALWSNLLLPEAEVQGQTKWGNYPLLNYWKPRVTGEYSNPYGFIEELLDVTDLSHFFGNVKNFRGHLFLGNLLHSLTDMKRSVQEYGFLERLNHQDWRPMVMPTWCLMEPGDFRKATWRMFASAEEVMEFARSEIIESSDKFWSSWLTWKKQCATVMSERRYDNTFRVRQLYLPGEPEGQW